MRAALVLAAGASRRFGRADKLLAPLAGRPLLLHAIARARESGARRIYLVLSSPRALRRIGRSAGLVPVRAPAGRPLAASLRAGLAAVRPIERELLIYLGDMPAASVPRALRLRPGLAAARPVHRGVPGHPLLVRTAAARAAALAGDRGLARLAPVAAIRGAAGNVLDIDDRAALRHAARGSGLRARR